MPKTTKPTLLRLRQRTQITTKQLADAAGVSLREAYIVEIGGFCNPENAKKVLTAFAALSGLAYTVDDIALNNAKWTAS